jgi:hypothetical protein
MTESSEHFFLKCEIIQELICLQENVGKVISFTVRLTCHLVIYKHSLMNYKEPSLLYAKPLLGSLCFNYLPFCSILKQILHHTAGRNFLHFL